MSWNAGALELLDHDSASEEALEVLGAEAPTCWRVARIHKQPDVMASDKRLLLCLLTTMQLTDLELKYTARSSTNVERMIALSRSAGGNEAQFRQLRSMVPAAADILALLRLPRELRKRFGLDVLVSAAKGWQSREVIERWTPALTIALQQIAGAAFAIAAGPARFGETAPTVSDWIPLGPTSSFSIEPVDVESAIMRASTLWRVGLPLTWLIDVWLKGLTIVDGKFVVRVNESKSGWIAEVLNWSRSGSGGVSPNIDSVPLPVLD